jgi:hypothetical protein
VVPLREANDLRPAPMVAFKDAQLELPTAPAVWAHLRSALTEATQHSRQDLRQVFGCAALPFASVRMANSTFPSSVSGTFLEGMLS